MAWASNSATGGSYSPSSSPKQKKPLSSRGMSAKQFTRVTWETPERLIEVRLSVVLTAETLAFVSPPKVSPPPEARVDVRAEEGHSKLARSCCTSSHIWTSLFDTAPCLVKLSRALASDSQRRAQALPSDSQRAAATPAILEFTW
jgi:hypothetical protein